MEREEPVSRKFFKEVWDEMSDAEKAALVERIRRES